MLWAALQIPNRRYCYNFEYRKYLLCRGYIVSVVITVLTFSDVKVENTFCSENYESVEEDVSSGNEAIEKYLLEENGMYVCGICFKRFPYRRGIRRHLLFICNKSPQFQCMVCAKKCKLKENLERHMIRRHMQPNF